MHDEHTLETVINSLARTRRTRMTERHRALVRETNLHPSNFILPLFVAEGAANYRREIPSMPGVFQLGIDHILADCEKALEARLGGIILFGIPQNKDEEGTEAYNEHGVIQEATRAIKKRFPELLVA